MRVMAGWTDGGTGKGGQMTWCCRLGDWAVGYAVAKIINSANFNYETPADYEIY